MPQISRRLVVLIAVLATAPSVSAQVLQPPPRPLRGLFGGGAPPNPNRTRQELTLSGTLLGGYDDNLSRPGANDTFETRPSGYVGVVDTNLRYWFGREARSIEVDGHGYMNTYRNVGVGPNYGADQSLAAHTTLTRGTDLSFSESLRYAPYFSLGLFGPVAEAAGSADPDNNPTNSLNITRTWSTDLSSSIDHAWTRQLRTAATYSFSQQTYVEGAGFDRRSNSISASIDRSVGRSSGIRGSYHHTAAEFVEQIGRVRQQTDDVIDGGVTYQRNLSRTRRVTFSGGAGGLHVSAGQQGSAATVRYWAPSGYGTARVDVGRSWNLSGDYRRALSVLEGVTPQSFVTHSALARAGGFVGSRVEAVVSAGYSNGQTGGTPLLQDGEYDGYTAAVQFRVLLARGWSSVVNYNYYRYQLNPVASQLLGVSSQLHRNSIRIGLTWAVPLYGSYVDAPRRQPNARN